MSYNKSTMILVDGKVYHSGSISLFGDKDDITYGFKKLKIENIKNVYQGSHYYALIDLEGNVILPKSPCFRMIKNVLDMGDYIILDDFPRILKVCCGFNILALLDINGSVWYINIPDVEGWLKTNNKTELELFQHIDNTKNIVDICILQSGIICAIKKNKIYKYDLVCKKISTFALASNDTLLKCESHCHGERGFVFDDIYKDTKEKDSLIILTSSGKIIVNGDNSYNRLGCEGICVCDYPIVANNISDFSCGKYHTLFLDKEGNVMICGKYGKKVFKMQKITQNDKIERIKVLYNTNILIDENNDLFISGYNNYGLLGFRSHTNTHEIYGFKKVRL